MVKSQSQPGFLLDFLVSGNHAAAGTTDEQGDARVDSQQFEDLGSVRKKLWAHENKPQRDSRSLQLASKLFGPTLQAAFIERPGPMRRNRILVPHAAKLTVPALIATA
jgi:hypothetical protein